MWSRWVFNAAYDQDRPLRPVQEILFGLLCGGCAILLRLWLDGWAEEVGPFALIYPLILLGTLYGHCCAGLTAGVVAFLWGWWHVVPYPGSFAFELETGPKLVLIHAASALLTLIFAVEYRRLILIAVEQRDAEIARGAVLMRELEHRTKNNFALVVSLLSVQKRQEDDPRIQRALDLARARIHSFAQAYANLAETPGEGGSVAMKPYLDEVVSNFVDGGFPDNVTVTVEADDCSLRRDIAVGIGLFVNEGLTNAAKHAFPDNRPGRVLVRLTCRAQAGWELRLEDDGVGFDPARDTSAHGGTGSRLMQAFAHRAQASFTLGSGSAGTRLRLASLPPPAGRGAA